MLEAKNLVKIYKPKRGVPVAALNNISLTFPKTGMVFILGKSGSGKSTLLNVLGGLDGFTSGDILVKGQSTKKFRQSSYDSYRNTYVGFIFQEYNVLDEFTVGANIALAIELQGRKATNEEINEILEKVDLVDYGTRKPNELSGGQKQRVAIARALVKKPEIIMADEPTGALDSTTGRQIFDTLKELSKEKLVMVVSHDREFAETYADRIIELADGKVISDVERNYNSTKTNDEEVITYSKNTISIKQGYQLTEEDRIAINNYLATLKTNATIGVVEDTSNSQAFIATRTDSIETDNSGFKLIKSKLSLKNSFKIGASSLKHKKFKLVMTILLSVVAFSLFGFSDTFASYDVVKTTTSSLIDSGIDYASFVKQKGYTYDYDETNKVYYNETLKITDEEVDMLKDKTGLPFVGVYKSPYETSYTNNIYIESNNEDKARLQYMFPTGFTGFVEFDNNDLNDYSYSIIGNLPDGSKNEIAITDYAYEYFKETAYTSDGDTQISISKEEDLIGKTINSTGIDFKITGIIDTGFNYERYRDLAKDQTKMDTKDILVWFALSQELESALGYSLHAVGFVGDGFIDRVFKGSINVFTDNIRVSANVEKGNNWCWLGSDYLTSKTLLNPQIEYFDSTKTALNEGEILLSRYAFINLMYDFYFESIESNDFSQYIPTKTYKYSEDEYKQLDLYLPQEKPSLALENIAKAINTSNKTINEMKQILTDCGVESDFSESTDYDIAVMYYENLDQCIPFDYYAKECAEVTAKFLNSKLDFANKSFELYCYKSMGFTLNVKIVGIAYEENYNDYNYIVFNDKVYDETFKQDGYLSYAVSPMPEKRQEIANLVKISYDADEKNVRYHLTNSVTYEIDLAAELFESLAVVFLWIGIAFAIFASLMLSNFIANSISYKKQDIGILRAIGSRAADVFRIFFAESFIIAMINYVLTMTVIGVIIAVINGAIRNEVGLLITILTLGFRQFAVMLGVCLLVAAIATFLPVYKNARKKPIDAIRGR